MTEAPLRPSWAPGPTELDRWIRERPEMESEVTAELVPQWEAQRAKAIAERSALRFVDRLPKNVPILLVHGSADKGSARATRWTWPKRYSQAGDRFGC